MKKYLSIILSLIFVLSLTSCTFGKDAYDTVTLEDAEYKKAFVGELYPIDDSFIGTAVAWENENSFYKYPETSFDCYIRYDDNAEPNIYFKSDQYDTAVSRYRDAENFNFFCLFGNIHDKSDQQIFEIQETDSAMFDKLLEFSIENEYEPFTSFNDEDGIKKLRVPDPNDWTANEIHFYKESKDGAFTTSRGYTFIVHESKLYLLYQYNFSNDAAPTMLLKGVPTEISNYFCSVVEAIKVK